MTDNKKTLTSEEIKEKYGYDIIEQYENMVYKFSIQFSKKSKQNIHDLLQESWVSVIVAHSKFKPEKGMKITSFVYSSIYNSLYKFTIENHDIVHIPWVTKFWEKWGYNKLKVDKFERELVIKLENKEIDKEEYTNLLEECKYINRVEKNTEFYESEIENEEKGISLDTFILENSKEKEEKNIKHGAIEIIEECFEQEYINFDELQNINKFLSGKTTKINNNIKKIIIKIKQYVEDNELEDLF